MSAFKEIKLKFYLQKCWMYIMNERFESYMLYLMCFNLLQMLNKLELNKNKIFFRITLAFFYELQNLSENKLL